MNLVDRIKAILLQPRSEWETINTEGTTVGELYRGFIIPLAAVEPISSIIGMTVFGISLPFVGTYKVPLSSSLAHALIGYLLTLGGTYVVALVVNALAPSFRGEKNTVQALKVTAYSFTAAWLAGIFSLIPILGIIGVIASLYSLYLLYLGLPVLMKVPQEKAVLYTIVVVVCAVVVFAIVGTVAGLMISYPGPSS